MLFKPFRFLTLLLFTTLTTTAFADDSICNAIEKGNLTPSQLNEILTQQALARTPAENALMAQVHFQGIEATFLNKTLLAPDLAEFKYTLPGGVITDQHEVGECHGFAQCTVIRRLGYSRGLLHPSVEFSEPYLLYWHYYEQANEHYNRLLKLKPKDYLASRDRPIDLITPQDGGEFAADAFLIKKYGMKTKEAMTGSVATINPEMLRNDLNRQIEIGTKAIDLAIQQGLAIDALIKIKNDQITEFAKILTQHLGDPRPTEPFTLRTGQNLKGDGQAFTATQFVKDFIGYNPDDYVLVGSYQRQPKNQYYITPKEESGDGAAYYDVSVLNLEKARMKELIVDTLKQGHPVWFGVMVSSENMHVQAGLLDPNLYTDRAALDGQTPAERNAALTAADINYFGNSTPNHAMTLTGYDFNLTPELIDRVKKSGKELTLENLVQSVLPTEISKFQDENSWGPTAGNIGYFTVSESYFQSDFFGEAVALKSLLKPEERALLDKPVMLTADNPLTYPVGNGKYNFKKPK